MSNLTKIYKVDSRLTRPAPFSSLDKVIQFLDDKLVVQELTNVVSVGVGANVSVWDFTTEPKVVLKSVKQVLEKPNSYDPLMEIKPLQIINFSEGEMETGVKDLNENETRGCVMRTVATFRDYFKIE